MRKITGSFVFFHLDKINKYRDVPEKQYSYVFECKSINLVVTINRIKLSVYNEIIKVKKESFVSFSGPIYFDQSITEYFCFISYRINGYFLGTSISIALCIKY